MLARIALIVVICHGPHLSAQQVEITGLPLPGAPGQVTGVVTGLDPVTHRLSHNLYLEGAGWWTVGGANLPINPDGSFSIDVGTAGADEWASHYSVSVHPVGSPAPNHQAANTLNLGNHVVASTYKQRYGTNLSFAGHNWGIKDGPFMAGPGNNVFTSDPQHVWVDQDGLHLTVEQTGGQWRTTEAILPENLGYGTYMFKTNSRQDILDANVTFGAFTWDVFGDDDRLPDWPNREIDFEDSRWGNPARPTNSQVVVQPWWVEGNLHRIALPDLSADARLTRFFTWSPGKLEFFTLLGDHHPSDFPPSAIIDHTVYTEDSPEHIVPEPGRENFRFNLWLNRGAPAGAGPIEVVITDFAYTGWGDFDFDGDFDCVDVDALVAEIAANTHDDSFDLNGDGNVDTDDLSVWLTEAGSANLAPGAAYRPGDATLDGRVDGRDFLAWNRNKFTSNASWCAGDWDASGVVDQVDFALWNSHKFGTGNSNALPEPDGDILVVFGAMLVWLCSRVVHGGHAD